MNSKLARAMSGARWSAVWFAWAMLLGCDDEASRKSVTSKATAVAPGSFEAEFPDRFEDTERLEDAGRFRDAGRSGETGPNPDTTASTASEASSGESQTSSSNAWPIASSAASASGVSTSDVASSSDSVSVLTAVGPALLAARLVVDLPCSEKVSGDATLCVNTGCVESVAVSDSWTVPGEPPEAYDVTIDLVGIVETVALEGVALGSNSEMRAVQASEPEPGPVNVYQLRVGDTNYVLNSSDVSGDLRSADGISFALGTLQGGTSLVVSAVSTDCQQRSTCNLQSNCTDEVVAGDAQTLEVQITAASL